MKYTSWITTKEDYYYWIANEPLTKVSSVELYLTETPNKDFYLTLAEERPAVLYRI